MEQVLDEERIPTSVLRFCNNHNITEAEFYSYFGSFEGIQLEIWNTFFKQTVELVNIHESNHTFSDQEKMVTFFSTFFEMLVPYRSYVLFTLNENRDILQNLRQLKGLRLHVKNFAAGLIAKKNEEQDIRLLKQPLTLFSEGAWLQTLFLLKYWMDDNSAKYENTDVAITKSVRAIFEVFNTAPWESVLDLGKFLWRKNRL